jgi:low affinity Fe/Cu permease
VFNRFFFFLLSNIISTTHFFIVFFVLFICCQCFLIKLIKFSEPNQVNDLDLYFILFLLF